MKKFIICVLILSAAAASGCKSKANPSSPEPAATATLTSTVTPTWTVSQTGTITPTWTVTPTNTPMSLTFQQNVNSYTGGKDNTIWQSDPDNNYGGDVSGFAGNLSGSPRRILAYFDLSGVTWNPSNTMIKADILYSLQNISGSSFGVTPYLLTRTWTEGTGYGNVDHTDSTWNSYAAGSPWTNPGGDYGAAAGPSTLMDTSQQAYVKRAVQINTSVINSWISSPSGNYGIVLMSDNETAADYIVTYTNEDYTASNRPKLEIFYY